MKKKRLIINITINNIEFIIKGIIIDVLFFYTKIIFLLIVKKKNRLIPTS